MTSDAVEMSTTRAADLPALLAVLSEAVAAVTRALGSETRDAVLEPLDDIALRDAMCQAEKVASRAAAVTASLAAEWDARRAWRRDGHRSAAAGVSSAARVSARRARDIVRRGRAMAAMPATTCALMEGHINTDHFDLLGRADQPWRHRVFADHERLLVEQVASLRWADATRVVDYWVHRVDADASAEDARLRGLDVHCWASRTLDEKMAVGAVLDPVGGEIFLNELDRLARIERVKDLRSGAARTPTQCRAAALVEMAARSASLPGTATQGRPVFTVLVGDDTARHLCQLASGVVLHPSELVPYVDAALMETVLFDAPTTVVGVSAQRSFTGALRRAIVARDKFCTHPSGCDVPADMCDIDHIVPWSHGGETRQENGRARCSTHNRHPDMVGPPGEPAPLAPIRREHIDQVRRRWRTRHGLSPPTSDVA